MRKLFLLILYIVMPVLSVAAELPRFDEEGISYELACYRHDRVSDLRYDVHFDIPADRADSVVGHELITFSLKEPCALPLDFWASESQLLQIKVNNMILLAKVEHEHIMLPAAYLTSGQNRVEIDFVAGNRSLNRNDGYLYTLFVPDRARTVFPCFDQPNMKARFTLSLTVPSDWTAVSNTYQRMTTDVSSSHHGTTSHRYPTQTIHFAETEPLSTYLFAFAAGRFEKQTFKQDSMTISAYYRETDSLRIAQLPEISQQVFKALRWLEDFTQQPYPFAKYDYVVLPGFQFGGMEHTGCTFYNDNTLFLGQHPTPAEQLRRTELIAHETAHMWFGDLVTMDWFNDVWTKEVFANYFAAQITAPMFPDLNYDLNWLRTYAAPAMSEDRGAGGTSIQQELDNMRNAGLVYNYIIYDKAPMMMRQLVSEMKPQAFQKGMRRYVDIYKYGNATWKQLVALLDEETPADVRSFSRAWVEEKGYPTVTCRQSSRGVELTQTDSLDRGILWPQTIQFCLVDGNADTLVSARLDDRHADHLLRLPSRWQKALLVPNSDGRAYGFFRLDSVQVNRALRYWTRVDGTARQSLLMTLNEHYLHHLVSDSIWLETLVDAIQRPSLDPLTRSTLIGYAAEPLRHVGAAQRKKTEMMFCLLAKTLTDTSAVTDLLRFLMAHATTSSAVDYLYGIWKEGKHAGLNVTDFMTLTYELAVRMPQQADTLCRTQLSRLTNPDRCRQFQFVCRAVSSEQAHRDSLFAELLQPANRTVEPWVRQALYYLNHPLRQQEAVKYIPQALSILPEIQRTGDIFFPGDWCQSLLAGHRSDEAKAAVQTFLEQATDLQPMLRCKVLNAAYYLMR